MEFDWSVLGKSIEGAGNILSGHYLQQYQRKLELEDFQQRQDYMKELRGIEKEEEQERLFEFHKRTAQFDEEAKKKFTEWETSYKSNLATNLGSPELDDFLTSTIRAPDQPTQLMGQAVFNMKSKLMRGERPTDEEMAGINQMPQNIQAPFQMLVGELNKRDEGYAQAEKLAGMQIEAYAPYREATALSRELRDKIALINQARAEGKEERDIAKREMEMMKLYMGQMEKVHKLRIDPMWLGDKEAYETAIAKGKKIDPRLKERYDANMELLNEYDAFMKIIQQPTGITVPEGDVDPEIQELMDATGMSLEEALEFKKKIGR